MPLQHTVEEIKLKNGAKGLLLYAPNTTTVHYDIQFRAGNEYVKHVDIGQTAHIMEHMAFGPNAKFATAEEFSQEFSRNGAYSNAYTGSIDMVYSVDAALMEWDRVLDLQLLSIGQPRFTEKILEAEKGNVHEELNGYANNHGRILWQTIMRRAGLDRWFDADEIERINPVKLSDIKEHHERTHRTKNMRFVIAGDLEKDRDAIIEKLEALPLAQGEQLPLPTDVAKATGPVHIFREDLPAISFAVYFFLNRELTRSELRAMSVLTHTLTGTFHSRIWGTARAQGICYGLGSDASSGVTGLSSLSLGGQVSEKNLGAVCELIIKELKDVRDNGITEDELTQAKEHRMGGLQMGTETVRSLVGWYADWYYEADVIDYLDTMPALIEGTTVQEIQTLVKEILSSGAWSLGVIGNVSEEVAAKYHTLIENELVKE